MQSLDLGFGILTGALLIYFLRERKRKEIEKKKESDVSVEEIEKGMKEIQNHICQFFEKVTCQTYLEDPWDYDKGTGGGITRVWQGHEKAVDFDQDENFYKDEFILEKAGVNYSGISGAKLPQAAATAFKLDGDIPFHATGVSLVIHPHNPNIPTIHMNIRYFQAGELWWFGGGIDVTPYYPKKNQIIDFHCGLKEVCDKHKMDYQAGKTECDKYFYISHRKEMRGASGIFMDHLCTSPKLAKTKKEIWNFIKDLGMSFTKLYFPLIDPSVNKTYYTNEQREFQLWRRSRYAEFNLVIDRGTKFGLQSEGRIESILMSLPLVTKWKYNWKPKQNSEEEKVVEFYLKPQNWVEMKKEETIGTK